MEPQPFLRPGDDPEEGAYRYKQLISAESPDSLLLDPDYCNDAGLSLLQLADSPGVIQLLLDKGADPNLLHEASTLQSVQTGVVTKSRTASVLITRRGTFLTNDSQKAARWEGQSSPQAYIF